MKLQEIEKRQSEKGGSIVMSTKKRIELTILLIKQLLELFVTKFCILHYINSERSIVY